MFLFPWFLNTARDASAQGLCTLTALPMISKLSKDTITLSPKEFSSWWDASEAGFWSTVLKAMNTPTNVYDKTLPAMVKIGNPLSYSPATAPIKVSKSASGVVSLSFPDTNNVGTIIMKLTPTNPVTVTTPSLEALASSVKSTNGKWQDLFTMVK